MYSVLICAMYNARGGGGRRAEAVSQERGMVRRRGRRGRAPPSHQRARLHVQPMLRRPRPHAALALAVLLGVRT